jgi:uncharacterized RDD family membrane protein YckC
MNDPAAHNPALIEPALIRDVISKRGLALTIDGVMIFLVGLFLFIFMLVFGLLTLGLGWHLFALLPLVPFCYYVLCLSQLGATLGQKFAGIELRRVEDLAPPSGLQMFVWIIGFCATIGCGFGVLLLVALVTDGKRTLHDMASGLIMVRRDGLRPSPFETVIEAGTYRP